MSPDDLHALEACDDARERNAMALRLADARTPGLDAVLARLILRPDLAGQRGTLVHALAMYDCGPHLGLLVDLAIEGGLEVAHEAFSALNGIDHVDGEAVAEAFTRLQAARAAGPAEAWRRDLLADLAELFE